MKCYVHHLLNAVSAFFVGALLLLTGSSSALAQVQVKGELTDDRSVAAGRVYEGFINVYNSSERPQQARIYQTDYRFSADGTNEFGAPGSTPRSNASWIRLGASDLTLAPGEEVPVKFAVHVPETTASGDSIAGTYWSMIMVEGVKQVETAPEEIYEKPVFTAQTTFRHGYQVATHVGQSGQRQLEFTEVVLNKGVDSLASLQVDVAATGNAMIRPEAWIELYDKKGSKVDKIAGQQYRIYPGTSVRYRFDLSHVPEGKYKALVLVDAGQSDILGAQYEISL